MFVVMIVGAVIGYSQSMDEVRGAVEKSMKNFVDDPEAAEVSKEKKAVTNAWNTLQSDFECCGTYFNGTSDADNSWIQESGGVYPTATTLYKVPKSCCDIVPEGELEACRKNPYSLQNGKKMEGCFNKFEDLLNDNKDKILIVGVVIVVIMFLNMLFAFAMCTMAN